MAQSNPRLPGASVPVGSESEFRQLLEALPAATYTCDAGGLITYFNSRAVELWGRAPRLNDPIDRFCGSFKLFASDGKGLRHDECWMALALRDRQSYNGQEIVAERPDGTRATVLAHANPIYDGSGELCGAVNVLVDISDRKRLEGELTAKVGELAEADRRKDEFLAMLAHELRNPLAPARNAAALLQRKDLDSDTAAETAQILAEQLDHLSRLVDDLLDVSRIVQGKVELRKQPVELAEVVRRAVDAAQPLLYERGHEFCVALPAEPVCLEADPVRLAQVLSNLLNNAAKYTPPGGTVRLTVEREVDGVAVHVRDNGAGIAPDLLPRVFDLFVQGDTSVDRPEGGLGIGLTLVKNLIELHDGSVVARSEGIGKGTEFMVRLPVLAKACGRRGDASTASPPVRTLRVLVVEDNVGAAKILAKLLEKFWGHEVRMAHDGPAAIEVADAFLPELVLCDVGLPHLSGYDVARLMRSRPQLRESVLVALTGYGTDEDRRRSAEAGFDTHLVKPTGVDALGELFRHPKFTAPTP
jgi:PAS domain S-box-containing protein